LGTFRLSPISTSPFAYAEQRKQTSEFLQQQHRLLKLLEWLWSDRELIIFSIAMAGKSHHPIHVHPVRPLYRFTATALGASMWFFVCHYKFPGRLLVRIIANILISGIADVPR